MVFDIRPIAQKYFSEATPQNYKCEYTTIGSGANGIVTIKSTTSVEKTTKIKVIIASGTNAEMSATISEGVITVTLGTGSSSGTAEPSKNTATKIAEAINALGGYTATASGTGVTSITTTVLEKDFTDGTWGTPCPIKGIGYVSGETYYVCMEEDNSKYNDNWKSFTLSSF